MLNILKNFQVKKHFLLLHNIKQMMANNIDLIIDNNNTYIQVM